MIYLLKDDNKYKVGFTSNWEKRKSAYVTSNPNAELISTSHGNASYKMESEIHNEILELEFEFISSKITGNKTEWFIPSKEFANKLDELGLKAFKVCKNRKINLKK